jgi:hypothetical protein
MAYAINSLIFGIVISAIAVVAYLLMVRNGSIGGRRFESFGPILGGVAIVGLLFGLITGHGVLALLGAAALTIGVAIGGGGATVLLGRMLPPT